MRVWIYLCVFVCVYLSTWIWVHIEKRKPGTKSKIKSRDCVQDARGENRILYASLHLDDYVRAECCMELTRFIILHPPKGSLITHICQLLPYHEVGPCRQAGRHSWFYCILRPIHSSLLACMHDLWEWSCVGLPASVLDLCENSFSTWNSGLSLRHWELS